VCNPDQHTFGIFIAAEPFKVGATAIMAVTSKSVSREKCDPAIFFRICDQFG
jgi:hypothetical protein